MPDTTTSAELESFATQNWNSLRELDWLLVALNTRALRNERELLRRVRERIDKLKCEWSPVANPIREPGLRSVRTASTGHQPTQSVQQPHPVVPQAFTQALAALEAERNTLQHELLKSRGELQVTANKLRNIQEALGAARDEIEQLRRNQSSQRSRMDNWGVSANCPSFVLKAVHKAWRKHLHPDSNHGASASEKAALHTRFCELESDFSGRY